MSTIGYYSNATEILPGLWIGDINSSIDRLFFKDKQIQCIINCTDSHPFSDDDFIKIKHRIPIPIRDHGYGNEDIQKFYLLIDESIDLIYSHIQSYNILVHCFNGGQCSGAIMVAYLMKYAEIDLTTSITAIKSKKPSSFEPNCIFEPALEHYWNQLHTFRKSTILNRRKLTKHKNQSDTFQKNIVKRSLSDDFYIQNDVTFNEHIDLHTNNDIYKDNINKQYSNMPHIDNSNMPYIDNSNMPYIDNSNMSYINNSNMPYIDNNNIPYIDNNNIPYIDNNIPYIDNSNMDNNTISYMNNIITPYIYN